MSRTYLIKKSIGNAGLFKNKRPTLPHLDIELTERCNNVCMHCYNNLPQNNITSKNSELSTDQWKDILDQAADLGALSVRFTGGEPLLRKDFAELYIHARRLGMKVFLFTNARLITEDLADLLTYIPPLKKIEISVYGTNALYYDKTVRVKGAYDEFRKGVDRLLERQIPVYLKNCELPSDTDGEEVVDNWIASLQDMFSPSKLIFLNFRTRRDSDLKNRLIEKLRPTPEKCASLLTHYTPETYRDFANNAKHYLFPKGDGLFSHCGAGNTGCVDAYGTYQICMLIRHPDMTYDLKNGSLKEAISNLIPRWRETKAINPEYLKRCAKCFLLGLCEQCPGHSWSEYGTLDTPVEYLCQVAHAQARNLELLSEGERAWEIIDWQERVNWAVQKANNKSDFETPDKNPYSKIL